MKRKGGNDIGKMIKLNKAVATVLLACAVLHGAAVDVSATQQEKERRILSCLRGTPSAAEAPRDILVNKPDYVVYVPKQPRKPELRDPAKTGDTYNDHFQVIDNPDNGRLYAFWTQASREGDVDQHIAFSKSVDKGNTWSPPVVLAGSANKKNPSLRASWQQPMLAKGGRIYCLWNQQTTSRGPHCGMMFGAFSDDDGETWSSPKLVPFKERMDMDPTDPLVPRRGATGSAPCGSARAASSLSAVRATARLPTMPARAARWSSGSSRTSTTIRTSRTSGYPSSRRTGTRSTPRRSTRA